MTYALFFEFRNGTDAEQFVYTPAIDAVLGQVPPRLAQRKVTATVSSYWRTFESSGYSAVFTPMGDAETIVNQEIHQFDQVAPILRDSVAKPGYVASRPVVIVIAESEKTEILNSPTAKIPTSLLTRAASLETSKSTSSQVMPDATILFMRSTLSQIANAWKDDSTGRVFHSLSTSQDSFRPWIASALLAVGGQYRNVHYGTYLSAISTAPVVSPKPQPETMPTPPADLSSRAGYPRPNGSIYYSRMWNGLEDVLVLRKAREEDQYVLLVGPPGTGKTAMVEGAFNEELLTVVISRDTEVSDLVGSFIPDPRGGFIWEDGPLLTAVRDGRPILLDEILLADPKVLSVLYPLMDGRNTLFVSSNPEIGTVEAKPGFYIIGAGNPHVPGAKMSPALVSRFPIHVEVTTDYSLARDIGISSDFCDFAEAMAGHVRAGTISWAPQFRELVAYDKTEKTWGKQFALQNMLRVCPEGDRVFLTTQAARVFQGVSLVPSKI